LRAPVARLVRRLNGGVVDVRFRGAAFRLADDANLIENGVMLVPGYNGPDIDFLTDSAPPDACFVDIGCNVGLYALSLAAARPAGRVLAIDANPRMVAQIAWNAAASGLRNVDVLHAAISDAEGRADLVIRKGDVAIVGIRETPDGAMPVRTLAAVVAEAGLTAIHGLKIDIEGHEDKALVPFLDSVPPALLPRRIVIELAGAAGDYSGCAAAFDRLGYRLAGRTRNNSLYLRD
jgi:FkbM family methyltransferase